MTDPINETSRVSITGGMAKAMVKYGAARSCAECQFSIPSYPGRYPKNCPRCEAAMSHPSESVKGKPQHGRTTKQKRKATGRERGHSDQGAKKGRAKDRRSIARTHDIDRQGRPVSTGESVPVVCTSRSHRIQGVIESGQQSFQNYLNDPMCSPAVTVRYVALPEGFRHWLEGPQGGLYYRVEARQEPLLVCEFDDARGRMRMFATSSPTRYLGFDPREGVVEEDHEGTFEPEIELNEGNVRMVEVGSAGLTSPLAPAKAAPLHLFLSEESATNIAERFDLPLSASRRNVGGESMWILVHESTGLALGRGEVRRLEEVYGSGPGHGSAYARVTLGAERARRSTNKTHDRVAGAYVEDKRASIKRARKTGQGRTVVRGGLRINVDQGPPKPRKDISRALQNKRNANGPGALRNRMKGAKKFHRSTDGQKMHRDLGHARSLAASHDAALRGKVMDVVQRIQRYNAGQARQPGLFPVFEDLGTLRPKSHGGTEQQTARGPNDIENPTVEDHLEAILRRLIVTQDMDVLQDVEFDDDTGAIYFFFDPILEDDEVEEIMAAIRQERGDIALIASPDMSLDGETVESDWWVLFLPGPEDVGSDPSIYARRPDQYATKVQAVTMTQPSPPEAVAQGIDVNKLLKSAGS